MSNSSPLISANQVTFARLIAMPAVCWALFRFGESDWQTYWWLAGAIAAVVACTDFVDGFLARKYGPTVLGGLMDPIADKVFIALMYLPFASRQIQIIPVWVVIVLFARELFVTALRSSHERRHLSLRSSYFAKAKTWTQMQVSAMLLLFVLLAPHQHDLAWGALCAAGLSLVGFAVVFFTKRYVWVGSLISVVGMIALFLALKFLEMPEVINLLLYVVLAVTWASGIDYIRGAKKRLEAAQAIDRTDITRWAGALGIATISIALLYTEVSPWVALIIVSGELACGGLDNLLCHHGRESSWKQWGARIGGTILFSALALLAYYQFSPELAPIFAWVAAAISAAGCGLEFYRGRDTYLDSKQRNLKT